MRRIWANPTFEIHGVVGGYTGPGVKTVIPPRAEVKGLVPPRPEPDGRENREAHNGLREEEEPDVKVHLEGRLDPYQGITTGPLADAVRSSVKFAFGKEPVFVREGGSIGRRRHDGAASQGADPLPRALPPEHGYHAPNENYDWEQAEGGMIAFAKYFETVGALGKVGAKGYRPAAAKK